MTKIHVTINILNLSLYFISEIYYRKINFLIFRRFLYMYIIIIIIIVQALFVNFL